MEQKDPLPGPAAGSWQVPPPIYKVGTAWPSNTLSLEQGGLLWLRRPPTGHLSLQNEGLPDRAAGCPPGCGAR